jgi:hypothetical protein
LVELISRRIAIEFASMKMKLPLISSALLLLAGISLVSCNKKVPPPAAPEVAEKPAPAPAEEDEGPLLIDMGQVKPGSLPKGLAHKVDEETPPAASAPVPVQPQSLDQQIQKKRTGYRTAMQDDPEITEDLITQYSADPKNPYRDLADPKELHQLHERLQAEYKASLSADPAVQRVQRQEAQQRNRYYAVMKKKLRVARIAPGTLLPPGYQLPDEPGPILKIAVTRAGEVTLDGQSATPEQVAIRLEELDSKRGSVWYYRESGKEEPHENAADIMKNIAERNLPVRLSTKPDYSDAHGLDGAEVR